MIEREQRGYRGIRGRPISKKLYEAFEIEYVDELPMVNVTGKVLVTKEARDYFLADLKDFFPFFMEHYFIKRLCGISKKDNSRIIAFRLINGIGNREYISHKSIPESSIGKIEKQKNILTKYLSDATDIDKLKNKVSIH